jgi:hypothetical protein
MSAYNHHDANLNDGRIRRQATVTSSARAIKRFPVTAEHRRRTTPYALPIRIPVTNTSAPPNPTCSAADGIGVSM